MADQAHAWRLPHLPTRHRTRAATRGSPIPWSAQDPRGSRRREKKRWQWRARQAPRGRFPRARTYSLPVGQAAVPANEESGGRAHRPTATPRLSCRAPVGPALDLFRVGMGPPTATGRARQALPHRIRRDPVRPMEQHARFVCAGRGSASSARGLEAGVLDTCRRSGRVNGVNAWGQGPAPVRGSVRVVGTWGRPQPEQTRWRLLP